MMAFKQLVSGGRGLRGHILFIGVVSLYDAWLVVRFAREILWHERNVVGRYLIQAAGGDVTLFVTCKLIGTAVVLGTLMWLYGNYRTMAIPVARSITVFQVWLLWFLTFSVTGDGLTPAVNTLAVVVIAGICLTPLVADEFSMSSWRRLRLFLLKRRAARQQPLRSHSPA